jgi:transcriptional regulator with XRE-family HTH domain
MSYLTQEQVGRRIAELREERGVSQRRLAAVLDLDPSALSRIESGERGLAVHEMIAAAEFLGVDPDRLLRDDAVSTPLFRNDGDSEQAEAAVAEFASIIDEFFTFEAAIRS